jgi:phosphatidylethanolamine/phosphatidyl-N-methylethanolamine N-methyltransferase
MGDLKDVHVQTEVTRRRYDRIAPIYDAMEWPLEFRFRHWRRDLWEMVRRGENTLEVGVGTGKSFPFYPPGAGVTGIDISEKMLERAKLRAKQLSTEVSLRVADAQRLPFGDATFDSVVTTFVFCSVPDPLRGLQEARRVLKQGGRLLMIEHVLSERPWLRRLMGWLDPVTHRLWGAHIDRETVKTVIAAGFEVTEVQDLSGDVVKRILARVP